MHPFLVRLTHLFLGLVVIVMTNSCSLERTTIPENPGANQEDLLVEITNTGDPNKPDNAEQCPDSCQGYAKCSKRTGLLESLAEYIRSFIECLETACCCKGECMEDCLPCGGDCGDCGDCGDAEDWN